MDHRLKLTDSIKSFLVLLPKFRALILFELKFFLEQSYLAISIITQSFILLKSSLALRVNEVEFSRIIFLVASHKQKSNHFFEHLRNILISFI